MPSNYAPIKKIEGIMHLLIIRDPENPQYDQYVLPPGNLAIHEAIEFVDATIKRIKEERLEDYMYEDLAVPLEAAGFTWPMVDECNETW
jgi:hypothetical protein